MKKKKRYYFIQLSRPIKTHEFQLLMQKVLKCNFNLFERNNKFIIVTNNNLNMIFQNLITLIEDKLECNMVLMVSHSNCELSWSALSVAYDNFISSFVLIAEVMLFGDIILLNCLKKDMNSIDKELINSAKSVVLSNGHRGIASEALYVHRNTLRYRLNKFYMISQLDVDDASDALLILLL